MIKRNSNNTFTQQRGFALISTLSIMALLMVVAISMMNLATVQVRNSITGSATVEAQANARMALMLAIGELQIAMGPDTRISARAELLAKDQRINTPISTNTPKAWWVGVSSSDPTQAIDSSGSKFVTWLISGLDPSATPAAQLSSSFAEPVTMYGDKTIDTTTLTGGNPIEAGKINITNGLSPRPGKIAWFIDDNGMKAQLAASRPEVKNDRATPYGQGILPGTYDIGILDGMEDLAGLPPEETNRILSLNDLQLIGTPRDTARQKRFSYTTSSRGVLSNVKDGGLKKDLTVAYENEDIFTSIWGNGYDDSSSAFNEDYIVMDSDKFNLSDDLKTNGYIHWEMFKDYYNSKKYIQKDSATGMEFMDHTMLSTNGISSEYGYRAADGKRKKYPLAKGILGPHHIGTNQDALSHPSHMPYGNYRTIHDASNFNPARGNLHYKHYKHSPITPVLMRMQQNSWLETIEKDNELTPEADLETYIRTKCQMWLSQYNPHNIGLRVRGNGHIGPTMDGFPNVQFTHRGMTVETKNNAGVPSQRIMYDRYRYNFAGLHYTGMLISKPIILGPGRSHMYAFEKDVEKVDKVDDKSSFGDAVKDLTTQSAYRDYRLVSDSSGTLEVEFKASVFTHGAQCGGGGTRNGTTAYQCAQAFWAPFSYNDYGRFIFKEDNVGLDDLNENLMASFSFHLRTSAEPSSGSGPAIRPLVDSNIRAIYNNTRWDSPLGLPVLASYSMDGGGQVNEQIPQMSTSDDPKGYAYWGAGRDAVDGYERVVLFDIPREDLVSIGQLQHANVGRFSYEPTYIVGNSYANLRIPQDQWKGAVTDTFSTDIGPTNNVDKIPEPFNLYDASYLVNEVLWDSSIFTTIPQVNDNYGTDTLSNATEADYESLRKGETLLANPRFLPYEPSGSRFNLTTLQENTNAYHHNAGHVMVDGAFNVNSTSIDAWEAFLSGTKGLPYLKLDGNGVVTGFEQDVDGVRFPRLKASIGGPMDKASIDEYYWTGFRSLKSDEVRALATEIVAEIKKRGPFLTMGEFVNRKLEDGELGQRGALQAALDNTVNKDIDSNFSGDTNVTDIPANSKQGSGFPGNLLQGDILQALSPFMTVRSDTFTIRAYGETLSADGNTVLAKAWCEATVQRYPDPVRSSTASGDPLTELANPTSKFGRTFRITSFRWLSPDEI
ncbi:MAG: hypothetical protein ACI9E1_000614 [Cryomorphaceae bacterium]|jgi:hypothetical protein